MKIYVVTNDDRQCVGASKTLKTAQKILFEDCRNRARDDINDGTDEMTPLEYRKLMKKIKEIIKNTTIEYGEAIYFDEYLITETELEN